MSLRLNNNMLTVLHKPLFVFTGDSLEPRVRKPDAAAVRKPDAAAVRLQLGCEVRGAFLNTEVELQDGAGNVLPAEHREVVESGGGRYYINALATVTKGDHFRCVVTQQAINHVTDKTHVTTAEADPPSFGQILFMSRQHFWKM